FLNTYNRTSRIRITLIASEAIEQPAAPMPPDVEIARKHENHYLVIRAVVIHFARVGRSWVSCGRLAAGVAGGRPSSVTRWEVGGLYGVTRRRREESAGHQHLDDPCVGWRRAAVNVWGKGVQWR